MSVALWSKQFSQVRNAEHYPKKEQKYYVHVVSTCFLRTSLCSWKHFKMLLVLPLRFCKQIAATLCLYVCDCDYVATNIEPFIVCDLSLSLRGCAAFLSGSCTCTIDINFAKWLNYNNQVRPSLGCAFQLYRAAEVAHVTYICRAASNCALYIGNYM